MRLFSNKSPSITAKILLIVILCWILPLVTVGGYSIFFYSDSINTRINEYLQNQFYYYNEFTAERINTVIEESRNATYDFVIENAYSEYARNRISYDACYNEVDAYLRNKYYLKNRYLLSAFFLEDTDDQIIFAARDGFATTDYYRSNVHSKVIELSRQLDTRIGFVTSENNVYVVRNMMMVIGPTKRMGVLVLQVDPAYLFSHMLKQTGGASPAAIVIALSEATLCYSSRKDAPLQSDMEKELLSAAKSSVSIGKSFVTFANKTSADGYTLGSAIALDKTAIYSRYENLKNITYFIGLLMIPMGIFLLYFMYRNVTEPIKKLVSATKEIVQGNFGFQVDESDKSNYEFILLRDSFNNMSRELQRLFDVVYREELALKDAKILALQSQINPHFLNNTLELMNWQARMAGDMDVSHMIEALSTLLDSSLDRTKKRLIPLSQELQCCDAYLYIISKRFGKRISIHKVIDETLLTRAVPRLILQPLLENAVVHGIEPVQSGTITMRVYTQDAHMVIEIINNGKLLFASDVEKLNQALLEDSPIATGERLGIKNVNQRIKLIYGECYGLLFSLDDQGQTVASIRIPLA